MCAQISAFSFRSRKTWWVAALLLLCVGAKAQALNGGDADLDASRARFAGLSGTSPSAVEMSYSMLKTRSGVAVGWLGGSYLLALNDNWGVGPTVYGSNKGNYGGLFIGGFTAQRRWALGPQTHLALSLFAGGGGGVSQSDLNFGGGLMLRPEISIRTELGSSWYTGLGLAYTEFPSGNLRSTGLSFVLGRSTRFESFAPSDIGRLGRSGDRNGIGFDELSVFGGEDAPRHGSTDRSGHPLLSHIGKVGAELRQYVAPGSWWALEAAGAGKGGVNGYMEILGSLGQDWSLFGTGLRLGGQVSAGLGGGGNVDTGSGWLLRAGPSLRWLMPWGGSLRLDGGLTDAPRGHYDATFVRLSLSMPLEPASRTNSWQQLEEGMVRGQTFYAMLQQIHQVRFKDGSREDMGQVSMGMKHELNDWLYGTAQAGTAAFGKAGAYAFGLFGAGVQTPCLPGSLRAGLESLVGAGGGGGVDLAGGALNQSEAWLQWEGSGRWERLRLRAGVGNWRALRSSSA
ncbi:MAG: hypothetical protein JO370_06180, partial [Paucibacter sp.]|nr:hypothetical protein [Roseateles sp.]